MNAIIDFFQDHPFVFGLFVGLMVATFAWIRGLFKALAREREIRRLKELLHTKLEVEARSHRALHDELEGLRTQNENLRSTVKALQQKPDRAELRQLHVYDTAVRALLSRSPGFGPAWQAVLDEAERQMAENERGLGAFVRRVFSPRAARQLPADTGKTESTDDSTPPE